jgi:hypothetical protein
MKKLTPLSENIFLQRHPLSLMGCQFGRNVTVIRLASGKLIIHSTADFTSTDVDAIRELGEPGWLIEATLYHDTLAKQGRAAFPDVDYLVPSRFPLADSLKATPLQPDALPAEWGDEVRLIAIEGAPKLSEIALFHRPSKTLVLADLLFNLPPTASRWSRFFLRVMSGIKKYPGMSRLLNFCIRDREAFQNSIRQLAALDFERIVVAHGDPIEIDAKDKFLDTIKMAGFSL